MEISWGFRGFVIIIMCIKLRMQKVKRMLSKTLINKDLISFEKAENRVEKDPTGNNSQPNHFCMTADFEEYI